MARKGTLFSRKKQNNFLRGRIYTRWEVFNNHGIIAFNWVTVCNAIEQGRVRDTQCVYDAAIEPFRTRYLDRITTIFLKHIWES